MFKLNELFKLVRDLEKKVEHGYRDMDNRLDNIEKVMIVQERNLKEHMRRSDNLEVLVQNIEKKELRPLRRHVTLMEGALKFMGVLGVFVSVVGGIAKIIGII
jgi:hypothetical protein